MAGIAGWIALARHARDEGALGPMLHALSHRGGTDRLCGYVDQGNRQQLVMGATLIDPPSRISLVLDGALLNAGELRSQLKRHGYRFGGDSAEEVLLRAYQHWDKDAVKQLRGGFAFAIWDARKERVLIARDRFGERPLYLHEAKGTLCFASEAKALLKAGVAARLDPSAMRDCLVHRFVPGPRTLFAGIRKLRPGACAVWQLGNLREVRYWTAPDRVPHVGKGANGEALPGFRAALDEALRQRPADGILLSGGLDSAVLLALASASGAKPRTFSLGLQDDKASELPQAARLAKHFATAHHEIVVTPQELISHLEFVIGCRDAPVARPSELALCRLVSDAAGSVKTVLSGDGCDEVLGGYRRYVAEVLGGGVDAFPAKLLAPLVSGGRFDTAAAALRLNGWHGALLAEQAEFCPQASDADPNASPLRQALYLDQTRWLPDQLLERNDRIAAAAGVEMRMPFLDHCLAEYVSSLPDEQRVRRLTTKWILREAARTLVPAPLRGRKGGWRLNVAGWLRNELREWTLEHLQGRSSVTRGYYDAATLDRVLEEHLEGKKNHEALLWTLLNIEIWHRTYTPA